MSEEAASVLRKAASDISGQEGLWEAMKEDSENVDWDVEKMLSAIDDPTE